MNRFNLFTQSLMFWLMVACSFGFAEEKKIESKATIEIELGGDFGGESVTVSLRTDESDVEILSVGHLEFSDSKVVREIVAVREGETSLKISVGELSYIFDIDVKKGLLCSFNKNAEGISFLTLIDEDKKSDQKLKKKVFLRLTGVLRDKDVEVYADRKLIFSDELSIQKVPLSKDIEIISSTPICNLRIVVSDLSYSFDVDLDDGSFLYFHKYEGHCVDFKQFGSLEELPIEL